MTQGDPQLPTIFNVVVYAVFCHWESLVVERDGGDIRNNDAAQTVGRTIRASNDGRRRMEEENTL